jgi:hypothetical protein
MNSSFKTLIHSVLLGKIYILLTYLVFNVQYPIFSQAFAFGFVFIILNTHLQK